MALLDIKVQLFNYISGIGDDTEDVLANEQTKFEVKNWLKTHADRLVVLYKDQDGNPTGGRIDLRRKICSQYLDTGFCHPPEGYCALWHICKRFIEGDCDGKCGRSHNFHDKDNRKNTTEAGLENFPSRLIRNVVAYSLPQVCLLYSKSECKTSACPYLHICLSVVRKTTCECFMSHNLLDQHNKMILERYNFSDCHSIWFKSERLRDFVLCNIIHPVRQKVCKSSKDSYQACRKETMLTSKLSVASNLMSPGSKVTPELVTVRKDNSAPVPHRKECAENSKPVEKKGADLLCKEEPWLSNCLAGNSASPDSKIILKLRTSRDDASVSPLGAKRKMTGSLQACQTKGAYSNISNRSRSNLTLQDSRSIPELHTPKPEAQSRPEPGKRKRRLKQKMSNYEGHGPNLRLSSKSLADFELSTQTKELCTLKPGELIRPEPGTTRDRLKQARNFEGQAPKMSGNTTAGSIDVQVQNRYRN